MPAWVRPRTLRFVPSGLSTFARFTTVTSSSEASGCPSRPVAIPRLNFRSWNCVRVKLLTNSESEPLRSTSTLSGSPVAASVERSPVTSPRMASSTATVSAMPSAVMMVVVFRTTRFRRL